MRSAQTAIMRGARPLARHLTDAPLRGAICLLLGLGASLNAGGSAAAQEYLEPGRRALAASQEPWRQVLDDFRAQVEARERELRLREMELRLDELEREAADREASRSWERAFGPPYD